MPPKAEKDPLTYSPEPTIEDFHNSDAIVKGIRGPEGSGKTVGCFLDLFKYACRQEPYHGKRSTVWTVVRNDYPVLLTTALKTFNLWFGDLCIKAPPRQPPIEATLKFRLQDNTVVESTFLFLALDVPDDVKKLKSLETTGSYINEASEMGRWVLTRLLGRRGRWPPEKWKVKPVWTGVIMDTNSCDDDHWWYKAAEEKRPEGWKFFDQPPALLRFSSDQAKSARERADEYLRTVPNLPDDFRTMVEDMYGSIYVGNPGAENVKWQPLGIKYWLNSIPGRPIKEINTLVMNEYGPTGDDIPVYSEYNDTKHCSKTILSPMANVGIALGFDFGLMPACTFAQISPRGQKVFLDELYVEKHGSMGIRQLSRQILVPHLLDNYLPWVQKHLVKGYGDPAGNQKAQTDEKTCYQILRECPNTNPSGNDIDYAANAKKLLNPDYLKKVREMAKYGLVSLGDIGVETVPACRTNAQEPRKDAVKKLLLHDIDNEIPAIIISKKCRMLRRALRGKYRYKRMQVSGEERFQNEPIKDIYSHICFAAGTMISVPENKKRIENIAVGDLVNTPYGPKKVVFTGHRTSEVVNVSFDSAPDVICTKNHPYWNFYCFSPIDVIEYNNIFSKEDCLWKFLFRFHRYAVGRSGQYLNFKELGIIRNLLPDIINQTLSMVASFSIARFGKQIMGLSRKALRFITAMKMVPIMTLQTFPLDWYPSITPIICKNQKELHAQKGMFIKLLPAQLNGESGTRIKQVRLGVKELPDYVKKSILSWLKISVRGVVKHIRSHYTSSLKRDSAQKNAFHPTGIIRGLTTLIAYALYAVTVFALTSMRKQKLAYLLAVENTNQKQEVYNIEVEDAHCFYANDILVSNCESAEYNCMAASYFTYDGGPDIEHKKQEEFDKLDIPSQAASNEFAAIISEIKMQQEAVEVWF